MQVPYDEGLANRIGAEPCVVGREVGGEASAGVRIGQPLSLEKCNRDADAVVLAEGETGARVIASAPPVLRGRRPWHVRTLPVRPETGRSRSWPRVSGAVRIGKATSRSR